MWDHGSVMTSTPPTRRRTGSGRGRRRDTLANRHVPTIIGILTVTVLAAATIVAWWLPGSRWSVGPVVAVASFLLALGWPMLARLHMPWLAQASSVTGLLIVTSGSMWVSLTVHERWSGIVPMAALIAVIGAASARFGRSAKAGVAFAMIAGLVAGLVVASIAWFLGQTSDLLPVVFPFIAKRFGEFAAFLTLGGVTGFGVGFAVSVVDALLGERASSAELANILGRGAAKFLVAALPVYAMIRIGGI